jgi:ComF family protein
MLWLEDFVSLVFPRICACCGNSLWKHEEVVCMSCNYHLPRTGFHLAEENPVTMTFRGRARVESAASFLWFSKGNKTQRLIHQLKYKGRKEVGTWLGEHYGRELCQSPFFNSVDVIVPVPLHKKKLMQRGYNQSELFAAGLSKSMNIPMEGRALVRTRATQTQTRKSRFNRWENVSEIFGVSRPEKVQGAHLLLVDDVITTGATLEACISALSGLRNTRISIVSVAFTKP